MQGAVVEHAQGQHGGEEDDFREGHGSVGRADGGGRGGDVGEGKRNAGQGKDGHRGHCERREWPEPRIRSLGRRAKGHHGGACEPARPRGGGRLVEGADGHEPDTPVDAAHRMAGQRPRDRKQDARDQEHGTSRGRCRIATERARGGDAQQRDRDADEADHADRRAEHRAQRPADIVSQGFGQGHEHAGVRGGGEEGAEGDEREHAIEHASSVSRACRAQDGQREDRPAERNRLAHEPGGAQP